tara:strand:- start:200 stop:2374 length:2175 start_codon:yes stop_codon:yes gene_type:complete
MNPFYKSFFMTVFLYSLFPAGLPAIDSEWILECKDANEQFRPYTANGYMGVKIGNLGTNWKTNHPHMVGNVWIEGTTNSSFTEEIIAPIPRWTDIAISSNEKTLDHQASIVENYRQYQHLKDGYIRTIFDWYVDEENIIKNDVTIFMNSAKKHNGNIKYTLTANYTGKVILNYSINAKDLNYFSGNEIVEVYLEEIDKGFDQDQNILWLETKTNNNLTIANASTIILESFPKPKYRIKYKQDDLLAKVELTLDVKKDIEYNFYIFGNIYTSKDSKDPKKDAKNSCFENADLGWTELFKINKNKWNSIWSTDLIITGENTNKVQKLIRSSLFNLMQSFSHDGQPIGVGPTGLSDGYQFGATTWEVEYCVFNPLLILKNNFAKQLLNYRFETKNIAEEYALGTGYKGLKWPLSSSISGKEMFSAQEIKKLFGNGFISLAHMRYFYITRDKQWLEQRGFPIIKGISNYWASRSTWDEVNQHIEFQDIGSPLAKNSVNNCSFTSSIIERNLIDAFEIEKFLAKYPTGTFRNMSNKIKYSFDNNRQIYLPYDNYNYQKTNNLFAAMMIYPIKKITNKDLIYNMIDHYEPQLDSEYSSTSYASFGTIHSGLGNKETAWKLFRSYQMLWQDGSFQTWFKNPDKKETSYYLPAAGSFLQQIIFGFIGISFDNSGIYFNPSMPTNWEKIEIKNIMLGGGVYNITIQKGDVAKIELINGVADVPIYNQFAYKLN